MSETNPLRAQMVRNIIAQNPDVPLTIEGLHGFLPPDFDLGDDDLEPYQQPAAVPPVKVGGVLKEPEAAARHAAAEAEAVAKAAADPAAIEAAVSRRLKADQDLANRRVELLAAQSAERDARAKLATAVQTFQCGFPPLSPAELRAQFVKEQAAIRQGIKDGTIRQRRPTYGKSQVDATAFYGRGGNLARGNYRRGAYPSQAFGASNRDPSRGPVAKPPITIT